MPERLSVGGVEQDLEHYSPEEVKKYKNILSAYGNVDNATLARNALHAYFSNNKPNISNLYPNFDEKTFISNFDELNNAIAWGQGAKWTPEQAN